MKVTKKYGYIFIEAASNEEIEEYRGAVAVKFIKYKNRNVCQCTNWDAMGQSFWFDENWQYAKGLAAKYSDKQ